MTDDARSFFGKVGLLGYIRPATQAAALLPVAALAACTMLSLPTTAKAESTSEPPGQIAGRVTQAGAPTAVSQQDTARPASASPAVPAAAALEPAALAGLNVSSQSWRRGGLGSKALITFTVRNENEYAVKDIEIACSFSRQDGTHLTDRRRVIPDGVVNMKSRKTFAHIQVGFVNIYANKANCTVVAANRI